MMPWDPDRLLENEVVSSANGRFRAVVRWYEGVPDFKSRRAGDVFPDGEPVRGSVTVALYESGLLAEIPIDVSRIDHVFVSDTGRYLVAVERPYGVCGARRSTENPFVTVYTAEGALVGSLRVDEVVGRWDLSTVLWPLNNLEYELRHESDRSEVFVVKVPTTSTTKRGERRIDVATVTLLDPKTDLFPLPRVYTTPVDVPPRDFLPAAADCAAAFDAPDVVRMQSRHFYGRAVFGPVPVFPEVMFKARVRGPVIVDVVVSEYGDVLCTRASGLPFGGTQAASNAARRWRFTPMTIDGHRVKFAGELLFQFQDVDEEMWRELMRYGPPFEE